MMTSANLGRQYMSKRVVLYVFIDNNPAAMTYDVPFLHHVTTNKGMQIFACFLNSSILYRLILKMVHTLIVPILLAIFTLQKNALIQKRNICFHGNQISHYKA